MKKPILYFLFLVLAACSSKEQKNDEEKDSTGAAMAQDTLVTSTENSQKLDSVDISFFQKGAYGGMVEVESSKKILALTENPDIKAFAEMMVQDHGAANEHLKGLALSKGYALPVSLPNSRVAQINKMDALKDEGRNEYYLLLMVNEHVQAIDLFSLASRSADKEINQFASTLLPKLKHHYMEVKKLDSLYRLPRANQGDDPLKLSDREKQKQ
jgi:putative membrane protein